jgi:hypothetical protein
MTDLSKHPWWDYIHEDLRELFNQSYLLIKIFAGGAHNGKSFHDYSFIVFPAAKGYEGYLKTLFKDLGFISENEFYSKRFRIGRALNPTLEHNLRHEESVYDRLVNYCGDKGLSNQLWDTWTTGRNVLFHWFPHEKNAINFEEAEAVVAKIVDTMDLAFEECKLNK